MADFNSIEYAWHNMEVVVLGRPLVRILDVRCKPSRNKKHIHGRGSKPVGIQKGNYSYSGSLKIGQSELIALQNAINLSEDTFNIEVAYLKGTDLLKKRIVGVDVQDWEEGMAQGDTEMEVTLTFLCMDLITV